MIRELGGGLKRAIAAINLIRVSVEWSDREPALISRRRLPNE